MSETLFIFDNILLKWWSKDKQNSVLSVWIMHRDKRTDKLIDWESFCAFEKYFACQFIRMKFQMLKSN